MELMVNNGRGYVLAQKNKSEDTPLGMIAIDSLFSPVKKYHLKSIHKSWISFRL